MTLPRRVTAAPVVEGPGSIVRPPRLLFILLCLAALTSSWTGFRVSGLNLADFFLAAALCCSLAIGVVGRTPLPVPWQFVLLPAVILMLMARDAFVYDRLPFQALTAAQYTTGDALGETVGGSATFLVRVILCWTAVGISLGLFRHSPRHLFVVTGAWAAGTACSVGWAVAQTTLALPDLPFIYHIDSVTRAVGFANHPNSFAETVGTVIPVVVFVAVGPSTGILRRTVGLVFLAGTIWALFLSGSRAGLAVGLFALVLSVVVRLFWSGKGVWGIPLALLAIVGAVLWLPSVWSTTRFSQGAAQVSDSERLRALAQGFGLFTQHLIGGSGLSVWLGEMVPLILLAGGGVILFLTFYASLGSVLCRAWVGRGDEVIMHLICSAAVVLVFGLLNNGMVERYLYWPFIIGFYLAAIRAPIELGVRPRSA